MRSGTTACERLLAISWLALASCEVATGGAFGGSFGTVEIGGDDSSSTGEPVGKGSDEASATKGEPEASDESESTGSTSDDTDETDALDESTGVPEDVETSTGAPDDDGGDGGGGWAPCLDGGCGPGMACMAEAPGEPGLCTQPCAPLDGAASCPPPPEGDAAPSCITVQGASWCALDCSHGAQCPAGTTCQVESDDQGIVVICL